MLTPSQAESLFKKSPAEKVDKLSKAVQKAIHHLEQKQSQQKGKAPETAYLLQRLKQDQEALKQERRQNSGIEPDKDQRNAIAKRVRKAYTLHSRRKRLFYNATESSYRKIAPVLGKKAPARTDIKGPIDAEHSNFDRQAEAVKQRAKSEEGDQAQSSATANTAEPAAEQGMWDSLSAKVSSAIWGPSTKTPEPKQETTKSEKKAEDLPQQPPSSTSDKPENAETSETHKKKASNSDASVVAEDKESQEEDTTSANPEEPKKQQSWTDWFLGRP